MNRQYRLTLLLIAAGTALLHAQSIGSVRSGNGERPRIEKAENGLLISWADSNVGVPAGSDRDNPDAGQVDIWDEHGRPLVSFNVLHLMDEARAVYISDVSARLGGVIAVAAVYAGKEGDDKVPPAPALLIFGFGGQLQSAYALDDTHGIRKLAVDEQSNIWTLTENFEDSDPLDAPMIVEYAADGRVVRELVPRRELWSGGATPKEGFYLGRITMGAEGGVAWVWLPGSTDLITISASDGKIARAQTGLPTREKHREDPVDVFREPSGDVTAVVREDAQDGTSELSYYAWSEVSGKWSRFTPGTCDGGRLLGVSSLGQIYLRFKDSEADICAFRRQ
ncbi:MAG TPA: hypothetical protein VF753_10135 [Terriglobales bacterium]